MKKIILTFGLIFLPFMASAVSPELDKQMAKSLEIVNGSVTSFVEGLKQAKDFAVEQAPEVAKEYLAWKFWQNLIEEEE
jgi:hypothetical protein